MYPRVPTGTLHRCHLTPCPDRDTAQEAEVSGDGTSSTKENSASVVSLQRGRQNGRLSYAPPRLSAGAGRLSTGLAGWTIMPL